ncbi:hypothetical protein PHYSODRAFT_333276 [Phytophthora sojae]|uniref:Uncharacterized protein n=1 Tax=Phytophthora sojae (strain P6497) TaxID=1094619 RepID=G4ZME8_PHYSP|nr:hypothetical protein PHYSODRAFT_333276 [Phytophthora sojae]EGZ15001.1 hypothetical protein PHYSODRAFT_333276 [Phytophthora sojae]|eukprot:XP_009528750.1 hypothetical protein PHYSODRAFT_333276 [Phytophthora sojae]
MVICPSSWLLSQQTNCATKNSMPETPSSTAPSKTSFASVDLTKLKFPVVVATHEPISPESMIKRTHDASGVAVGGSKWRKMCSMLANDNRAQLRERLPAIEEEVLREHRDRGGLLHTAPELPTNGGGTPIFREVADPHLVYPSVGWIALRSRKQLASVFQYFDDVYNLSSYSRAFMGKVVHLPLDEELELDGVT